MAVLHRTSVNIYMSVNNSRSKLFLQHMLDNANVRCLSSFSNNNNETYQGKRTKDGQQQNNKYLTFESIMEKRRHEARKSILVQVNSERSSNDLYSYCQNFGNIINMFHYVTSNKRHMMLVEYTDASSVTEVQKQAIFLNPENCIPVRSSTLWFSQGGGKELKLLRNMEKNVKHDPILINEQQLKRRLLAANSFSDQMSILHESLKLNDLCTRLRYYAAAHLEMQFSGLFPNIAFYPFGSSVNGFGKKDCDLDLVTNLDVRLYSGNSRLIFQAKTYYSHDVEHARTLLTIISDILQHLIPGVTHVRRILHARVPIIKFQHIYANIDCDLSLSNMSAIYMSELLYLYGEMDSRVRPLIVTIRNWAKHQKLTNDNPGHWITNFSLTLLAIFYLQQVKILPSLNKMREYIGESDKRYTEDAEDCSFPRNILYVKNLFKNSYNKESLEELLIGFFKFYSSFDFDTCGLCIVKGTAINKDHNMPLYIVNPLQPALNVSRNVKLEDVLRFKAVARRAINLHEDRERHHKANWGLLYLWNLNNNAADYVANTKPQRLEWLLTSDDSGDSNGNGNNVESNSSHENGPVTEENEGAIKQNKSRLKRG